MGLGKKLLKTSPVGYAALKVVERKNDPEVQATKQAKEQTEQVEREAETVRKMEATRNAQTQALPAAGLIDGLHRKAQDALKQNLARGEEVRVVVHGPGNAAMIGTDRRVFIFKTGVSAGATFGAKFTSFDYRNISGVQLHTGAMTGSVVVDVAGAAPVGSSYWGQKNNDPQKAQNAIPITRPYDLPKQAVARLRELIAAWHDHASAGSSPAPSPGPIQHSIPDQIRQIGELRDQGLLTPEEFEAKKADLLSRL